MATQLWFVQPANAIPGIHRASNSNKLNGSASGWQPALLSTSRGTSVTSEPTATVTGPTNGLEVLTAVGSFPYEWISHPLAADVTISGTVTLNLWGSESSMSANVAINAIIDKLDPTNGITQVLKTANVTELGTTSSANNFTATPTSTAFKKGDRIRVRIFGDDVGTMASTFTWTFVFSHPTASATGDSWIQFTENLTFQTTAPSGTILYPTTATGPAVGANDEREMWTSRGGSATTAVTNSANGFLLNQITGSAGGTALEWYSKPLQAFTLSGLVWFNMRFLESAASIDAGAYVELAVVNGDGSGASVWCSGGIVDISAIGNAPFRSADGELSSSSQSPDRCAMGGYDKAVTDGQRLRLRVYATAKATSAMVSGGTVTFGYNSPTGGGVDGDTWLQLSQTVSEFVSGVSGTVAVTLGNVTSAASGTPTVNGTTSQTLANVTSAASGTPTVVGSVARTLGGTTSAASGWSGTITGTVARTLANVTSAAAGTTTVLGTVARTLGGATSAASGTTSVLGTLAQTLANVASTASGTPIVPGSLARTLSGVSSTATGTTTVTGTLGATLANVASTAAGSPIVDGSLARTLDNVTVNASGDAGAGEVTGTVARTLDGATSSAAGSPIVQGSLSRTLGGVAPTASGTTTVVGSVALTLSGVTSSASGGGTLGTLARTLANVTSSAAGTTTVLATLARTLAGATSTAAGTTTVLGTVGVTLAGATASGSGGGTLGTLARTLDGVTSAASGSVGSAVAGTLARTLSNVTSSAQGTTTILGSSARTLGGVTSSASGTPTVTGSVARTLGGATSSAAGTTTVTGTSSGSLMGAACLAQGTTTVKAQGQATLVGVTSSADGTVITIGSALASLAGVTSEAFGFPGTLFHPTLTFGRATRAHPIGDAMRVLSFASFKRHHPFGEPELITTGKPTLNLRYALEEAST